MNRSGSAQFIYESLHGAILARRLAPCAPLSQRALGRLFGAGGASVRQALQRLAREGAVELAPRGIASVARATPQQVRQVLDTRLLLEAEIVRQLCGRLDANQVAGLREEVARQQACLETGEHAGVLAHAARFHRRLAELAGNALLLELLDQVLGRSALSFALSHGQAYTPDSCQQQLALLDALQHGDALSAGECLKRYLDALGNGLRFAPAPTTDLRAAFAGRRLTA